MNRRRFLASPLVLLANTAAAAEDYPRVTPGTTLTFPRDLGSHPAYRNEWWYITGQVKDSDQNEYGVQVTFFRNRPRLAETNPSRFAPRQLLFAHAALADPRHGRLRTGERAARAGFELAEASEATTAVWIDDWSLKLVDDRYVAIVAADDFQFELTFTPTQEVLLEGENGFSQKEPDPQHASYYYSQPHLAVSGVIRLLGKRIEVTGRAWLDHEWSSESLSSHAIGWDWVGLNLHDGAALMAFRIRARGEGVVWAGGTYRAADGRRRVYRPDEVRFTAEGKWRSPRSQVDYPTRMRVAVGERVYVVQPLFDDQEFDSRASTATIYWEGAVRVFDAAHEVGRGYLELTGYWRPLKL